MPTRAQPGAERMARTIKVSSIRGMRALEHCGNKIARLSVEIVDMWGVPLRLARPRKSEQVKLRRALRRTVFEDILLRRCISEQAIGRYVWSVLHKLC